MNKRLGLLALFAFPLSVSLLVGCIGSDPEVESNSERTRGMCSDGKDNDGDGHFDCYDPDCRIVHDSILGVDITDTLCHYERVRNWVALPSSSAPASSVTPSSSSVVAVSSSSVNYGFPFTFQDDAPDSVQILAIHHRPGSNKIALVGRIQNLALYGILDSNGQALETPSSVTTPINLAIALSPGAVEGRVFTDVDTNLQGMFVGIGSSIYANRTLATSYFLNTATTPKVYNNFYVPHDQFIYSGYNTPTTHCLVTNDSTTGYVLVDVNISDDWMASNSNYLANTTMARGEVAGNKCAGIGTRTVTDSSQIWLLVTSLTNNPDVTAQVTTGASANEVAYDLETIDSLVYIAAKIDNQVRMLVYNMNSDSLISAGTDLGPGTPWRIRKVTIDGNTRLLMVGESGGRGRLWLFNTAGSVQDNVLLQAAEAEAITDVAQLGSGHILASGWKSTGSTGTMGIILKLSTSLSIIP